jgi:Domain of unknown function (DUF4265)
MDVGKRHDHVVASVGPGTDVQEELAVGVLPDGTYRLLVSPALTIGLAAGDVFEIHEATLRTSVLRRGGNLTIWLYPQGASDDARRLSHEVDALGGTFDGSAQGNALLIFTMPVAATFSAIEAVFNRFLEEHPESEWYYGNVYADDGVTPLGWWEKT